MCFSSQSLLLTIYLIVINCFGLFLRFVAFTDYFECYACREMNSCKEDFDYIVVGSGSAGSIVARRLAEDPHIKVLLIEAGSYGNQLMEVPAMGPLLQQSIFDWQHRTVPQKKACLGLDNKVSLWPMGRIVGGSSMLNNMIYMRGHRSDFTRWYENKTDFNYEEEIAPYFNKLEASLSINNLLFVSNISEYILAGAASQGFPLTTSNMDADLGFSTPKACLYLHGSRFSPAHQLRNKPNLVILTNSQVNKVLLRDNFEASGVSYVHLDEEYIARASRGVILAAGVIGTPQILMLSGIGPRKHLQQMKITPRVDLPVGENLQDHVTTGLDLILLDTPPDLGLKQMFSPLSAWDYFVKGQGPWTSIGCEIVAFFKTESSALVPDLQFMVLPMGVSTDNGTYLRGLLGVGDRLWGSYFKKIDQFAITILPLVLHPRSRGVVKLKSKNPKVKPLIDPHYLWDDYDVEMLIKGVDLVKKLLESESMKRLGATLNPHKLRGCDKFEFDTKRYWECYVRHLTITSYHPIGTCKMGEVVDFEFQVKGLRGLYVVDGSILPELPSGNPSGAIMMMAEKAADVIKNHRILSEKKTTAKEIFVKGASC